MRRSLLPLILFFCICLLVDGYVFQAVNVLTYGSMPAVETLIHLLYWTVSVALILAFLYLFYKHIPERRYLLFFNTIFNAFVALFVTKLTIILVLLGEDIYRVIAAAFRQGSLPPRSILVSEFALVLSAVPFFSFLFGVTRGKYHYKVHQKTIYYNDLPEEFEGFAIVQISDIHAGGLDNPQAVQRGVDLLNAQGGDLFVFTGDLVNNHASEIVPWLEIFKQIKAPYGKFSVLGNHDYGDYIRWNSIDEKRINLQQLLRYHEQLGFKLLLDEHLRIQKEGAGITLIGVENWGLGFGQRGNLKKALNGTEAADFKILLSHDPSHWDAEVSTYPVKIHLTLSGHTHGMQFGIELFGFKWSPVKYRYPNWAGLAEKNGRYLYVNRGFGFLGFSGRVGIWPEITVITLRKAVQK